MAETDLSSWLSIADAALVIGCSKRTVERLGRAKQLEQRLRRQEGTPPVAVYNPEDVSRMAQERRREPAPFVVPHGSNGNGSSRRVSGLSGVSIDTDALAKLPVGDDPIRQLFAAALRAVLSPPSPPMAESVAETLYVTVKQAAAILGLPQADVRRLIHDGDLNHRLTGRGGIRIRRKDLEQL